MLSTGLVVIHNSISGGEHDVTETTGRKDILNPLLNVLDRDVEAGGDNTALVKSANKLHNDLAGAVVVDDLELTNITILLHNLQELDHNLGRRSEQNLSLSTLLSVGKGLKAIGQHGHSRHLESKWKSEKRVKITTQPV